MTQRRIERRILLKLAATAAVATPAPPATPVYNVVRGDTLSGIAKRNNTTTGELVRINGISNPHRISVGQPLRLPAPAAQPAAVATPAVTNTPAASSVSAAPAAPAVQSTPETRLNAVAARLHARLNNPALEAAILANFNRETGGKFDYATKQVGGGGGYGLPQYTGPSLAAYKQWLADSKLQDSANSQIDYFVDKYMPSRSGYKTYMDPKTKYTSAQYADWLHRHVFTPAHAIKGNKAYSQEKIDQATKQHNEFMKNRLKAVNGVWQAVKEAAARDSGAYEPPYTARQMLDAGYSPELVRRLMADPVHRWRADTGIELIHKEPDLREALRVWVNWNRMTAAAKRRSDRKSIALFGVDNKTHFERLRPTYEDGQEVGT